MANKIYIIAFLFFRIHPGFSQKVIQKEIDSEGIQTISIYDDGIYKIEIHSSEEKVIKISTHISGEHSESIIIEENSSDGKLELKTGLVPYFTLENDKLAAHKIMAIELKMAVPETIAVEIKSKLASVFVEGTYQKLAVAIENGNCDLRNFSGNAYLKTTNGNITVIADSKVSGKAISKNAFVKNELSLGGNFLVEAESINGSISLLQTK